MNFNEDKNLVVINEDVFVPGKGRGPFRKPFYATGADIRRYRMLNIMVTLVDENYKYSEDADPEAKPPLNEPLLEPTHYSTELEEKKAKENTDPFNNLGLDPSDEIGGETIEEVKDEAPTEVEVQEKVVNEKENDESKVDEILENEKEEEEFDVNSLTVDELREALDKEKVEYKTKDLKKELVKLYEKNILSK